MTGTVAVGSSKYWSRLALALLLLTCSLALFHVLGSGHDKAPLPTGNDWLLRRLPVVHTGPLLTWGWLAIHAMAFFTLGLGQKPRVPFYLASMALFVAVRSVFVSLMPVGPPEGIMPIYRGTSLAFFEGRLIYDNELFFSGHTAMPYLYALFSAHNAKLRFAFFACSAAMGVGVLLTRNHYTMDVLAAFFITHSIYLLSRKLLGRWDAPSAL
jgi:hypothetical protein